MFNVHLWSKERHIVGGGCGPRLWRRHSCGRGPHTSRHPHQESGTKVQCVFPVKVCTALFLIQWSFYKSYFVTGFLFCRKQYQATFKFCWNIDSGQYFVVDSDSLKEISAYKVKDRKDEKLKMLWHFARRPAEECGTLPDALLFPSWRCSNPPPAPSGSSPMSPSSGVSPSRPSLIQTT